MQVRFLSGALPKKKANQAVFVYYRRQILERQGINLDKKNSWKEKRNVFLEWCKDIGLLIKENKKITIIVVVFILLVVSAIVISNVIGKNSNSQEATVMTQADSTEETTITVPEEPLEEDAYPEINTLVKQYYQAMADGDISTLQNIKSAMDDKEQIKIQKKSEYIENYPTVKCYTKKGPVEDSFVVYAYYEVKLKDFDSLAPGLNTLYICKNKSGNYFINDGEQDESIINYCKAVSSQDDVIDLFNTVQVKYNDLKTTDEELSKFLDELPDLLTAAVGEELAKLEAPTEEATEETTTQEEATTQEAQETTTVVKKVKATDVVNVRSSDSETADKLGKAQKDEVFTLLEEKGNGWSKIEFEGKEAFVKSEYLTVVSEETVEENDEQNDEQNDSSNNSDDNSPVSGTAIVKTTVNVRSSASETADKLGVCYQGDKLDIVMKQADGWTKVKYKDKTGYVKSEFLE